MPGVTFSGVQKRFGQSAVIRHLDLHVEDGLFTVIVGPSGSGKSTLLRLLAGLEQADAGEIRIGGKVVNKWTPADRNIAMVFQNYALYPHMTVRENMAFALHIARMPRADASRRVDAVAARLDLVACLDRYPRQLSGGQQQRVAIGRAIVRQPQIFLFDEPLSNLDSQLRLQMRTEIRILQQQLATTAIYVTHDQFEAMTMGDRIVVMRDGRIEQYDTPTTIYERPCNTFVAGFVGSPSMNMFKGVVQKKAYVPVVEFPGGGALPLPPDLSPLLPVGMPVIYGIRPEHLAPCMPGHGIAGTVVVSHSTGAMTEIHLRRGPDPVVLSLHGRHDVSAGTVLHVDCKAERAHLFNAESGITLCNPAGLAHSRSPDIAREHRADAHANRSPVNEP